jgi:uncharacterized protein YjiS (DUF1127 family)
MNAYVTKEELNLLQSSRVSYPQHVADAQASRAGSRLGLFGRIGAFLERQRVLAELNTLTDRELADIGLTRGEMGRVFDPAFPQRRS